MRFASWSAIRVTFKTLCIVSGLLLSVGMLPAAPARPNPGAAKAARTSSENLKKQATDLTAKYAPATGEVKTAAEALAAALTVASAAQEKVSGAYEAGIATDTVTAVGEATRANAAVARARDLLTVVETQASYTSETTAAALRKLNTEAANPQFEAFLTARKAAAAAFGKVAAALTANAPADVVDTARDEAFAASKEVLLANRIWRNAVDLAPRDVAVEKTSNTDLGTKVAELKKTDADLVALLKQQNELELKIRKLERQRTQTAAAANELAKAKKKK